MHEIDLYCSIPTAGYLILAFIPQSEGRKIRACFQATCTKTTENSFKPTTPHYPMFEIAPCPCPPPKAAHPPDLDKLIKLVLVLVLVLGERLALDLCSSFLLGDATRLDG
jgi:hypothetical protein